MFCNYGFSALSFLARFPLPTFSEDFLRKRSPRKLYNRRRVECQLTTTKAGRFVVTTKRKLSSLISQQESGKKTKFSVERFSTFLVLPNFCLLSHSLWHKLHNRDDVIHRYYDINSVLFLGVIVEKINTKKQRQRQDSWEKKSIWILRHLRRHKTSIVLASE